MAVEQYMIDIYVQLVRAGRRTIESLPEQYRTVVATQLEVQTR